MCVFFKTCDVIVEDPHFFLQVRDFLRITLQLFSVILARFPGQPAKHKPWARASRAVQGAPWAKELACANVYLRIGEGGRHLQHLRSIPHAADRERWRVWEVGHNVFHFMDDQDFHKCLRTQKRTTMMKRCGMPSAASSAEADLPGDIV